MNNTNITYDVFSRSKNGSLLYIGQSYGHDAKAMPHPENSELLYTRNKLYRRA